MLASSLVNTLNPWAIFLSSAVALWLFIWGGIRLWHRRAAKTLEEKFQPLFDGIKSEVKVRFDAQDLVLANVQHEVTLNNGGSLKDGVRKLQGTVTEIMDTLTTPPATALDPLPRLGIVDTQRIQAATIRDILEVLKMKVPA